MDAVDIAILFTKTLYSRSALEGARTFIGRNTYVLTLQNGLGNVELIHEFVDMDKILVDAGFNAQITEDVFVAIWEKVGFNAAINSTTAIVHAPCGAIGSVEEGRDLAEKIATETAKVANAHGVNVNAQDIIKSLENTYVAHKDHFTSMAQDVLKKRKTEVRFINGGIVKKAKEKGIEVPYIEAVYDLLRIIEDTYEMQE